MVQIFFIGHGLRQGSRASPTLSPIVTPSHLAQPPLHSTSTLGGRHVRNVILCWWGVKRGGGGGCRGESLDFQRRRELNRIKKRYGIRVSMLAGQVGVAITSEPLSLPPSLPALVKGHLWWGRGPVNRQLQRQSLQMVPDIFGLRVWIGGYIAQDNSL